MHINSFYLFTIKISSKMITLVYYQAFLSCLLCSVCKDTSKKTCTYNKIVIVFHLLCVFVCKDSLFFLYVQMIALNSMQMENVMHVEEIHSFDFFLKRPLNRPFFFF